MHFLIINFRLHALFREAHSTFCKQKQYYIFSFTIEKKRNINIQLYFAQQTLFFYSIRFVSLSFLF